ncbi:hypothetical protein [Streptomyces sp. SID3343]|uniref:hypothetical protein n=1 Tax=Streptomyces sp. SID3343 TaxID=2690260 RepID=UPI0013713EBE|nr:hypothetical protein [Streptomyces sp. SID3343]MYW01227.1 hypothetical protein [Streptomyces sp. SID3343]
MNAEEPPDDEALFAAWLDQLTEGPCMDVDFYDTEPGDHDWLRAIHRAHGAISAARTREVLEGHRRAAAARSLVLVLKDLGRTGGPTDPGLEDERVGVPHVLLGSTALVNLDAVESLCETADAMQELLATQRHLVWPLCPSHGFGLHARIVDGRAQWICAAKEHTVAAIGSLGLGRPRR